MCVKPRKSNVSGLPRPPPLAVQGGEPPELDQPRLVDVQLQAEPREPLAKIGVEPFGVVTMLKAHDEVIREAHDDHVAARVAASAPLGPQVRRGISRFSRMEIPSMHRFFDRAGSAGSSR